MLKIFLAEDEVIVRETIKRMIPWEELGFDLWEKPLMERWHFHC